jgi:hypothetical protein
MNKTLVPEIHNNSRRDKSRDHSSFIFYFMTKKKINVATEALTWSKLTFCKRDKNMGQKVFEI